MNQNPPPTGNPFYGHDGSSNPGPDYTQNQQPPYPAPPPEGTPTHSYPHIAPGGYPPPHGYGVNPHDTTVMSTKDWILVTIIMMLPCVNIIMLFVWAFSSKGNHNRRNYCRANLIVMGVFIGLYLAFILFLFLFGFGVGFLSVFM